MKLVFLHPSVGYGGASKMIVFVANHFARKGDQVSFITFESDFDKQGLDSSINHIYYPINRHHYFSSRLKAVYRVRRFFRLNKPDVGIGFLYPAKSILLMASVGSRVKIVLSERGDPQMNRGRKMRVISLMNYLIRADRYVFQTEYAKNHYPSYSRKKGIIIQNAIAHHRYQSSYDYTYNSHKRERVILSVGRMDLRAKRQDILVDAFELLMQSNKYSGLKLRFLGDGQDMGLIKEMVARKHLEEYVEFEGYTENVYPIILNSFVYCLSSDHEGIPNSLLEALSVGIPCISTDYGPGGVESIMPSGCGLIVERGDARKLAEAISTYLDNLPYWERCGQSGCLYVNDCFSEAAIEEKWDYAIRSLV